MAQATRQHRERIRIIGEVRYELRGPDGRLKQRGVHRNLVVNDGDAYIADRILTTPSMTAVNGMRLGTGTTPPAKGQGALITPLAGSRKAFDATYPSRSTNVVTFKVTWAAGEATADGLAEVGIDDNGGTPYMPARGLLTPIVNKGVNDTLAVTWTWTVTGA